MLPQLDSRASRVAQCWQPTILSRACPRGRLRSRLVESCLPSTRVVSLGRAQVLPPVHGGVVQRGLARAVLPGGAALRAELARVAAEASRRAQRSRV
eukprot:3282681-Pleurochrysis_carterae.AAC.1